MKLLVFLFHIVEPQYVFDYTYRQEFLEFVLVSKLVRDRSRR